MYYWQDFERVLTIFMKLALLHKWDYPVKDLKCKRQQRT